MVHFSSKGRTVDNFDREQPGTKREKENRLNKLEGHWGQLDVEVACLLQSEFDLRLENSFSRTAKENISLENNILGRIIRFLVSGFEILRVFCCEKNKQTTCEILQKIFWDAILIFFKFFYGKIHSGVTKVAIERRLIINRRRFWHVDTKASSGRYDVFTNASRQWRRY